MIIKLPTAHITKAINMRIKNNFFCANEPLKKSTIMIRTPLNAWKRIIPHNPTSKYLNKGEFKKFIMVSNLSDPWVRVLITHICKVI